MASSCSTCPVCLRELGWDIQGKLGKPENCGHLFCFTCIHEWAKNVNTCPVDRIKFNHIEVLSCKSQRLIRKVYVADHSLAQVLADPEDVTYCEICHECNREDRLLLCDGCDRGYHLECLVPPLDTIPEGDWYCSLCESIVRSQHTIVFSSDEENSVTIVSEESSEDSDTLQQRQGARRVTGAHLVADSEEDSSESEEDDSIQSDVYPGRPYAHNQLRLNCLENSSEDVETKSDTETQTGQESNFESGKQSGLDSEGSLAVGLNLGPRFRKSRALCSESEQSGSDSEGLSAVGLSLGPRSRKRRVLGSESEQSGSDSKDSLAVGLNLGPRLRKRRVLGSESEEEEGECDILLQQPIPKRRCRFKDLPNPNVVSLKEEDVCTSDYGSPSDKILNDGTDTPGSAMCPLAKCAKKPTPVRDLLPCSNVGRKGEINSMSLKGKMPISSSRQAKKKAAIHIISSDDDSDTSIHSGYCSPAHKFTLTSDKGSCDSTFVPVQHLKDSPDSSPHLTRQHMALNRTRGQSDSKSNSDNFSAEGRLLRSAKHSMQNGSFKCLPDDFEEILSAGRGSVSKQAGTKKLSAKGTTKKQTKKRKRGRKCVVSRRNQPSGIKKKQKRRRRRRRKFKQRKASDVDPTYSPEITLRTSRGSVQTRSRARTAATHSPRDPTFRAAVIEAYRHENTITGLQQAQALLRQRRDSLLRTPLRYGTAAAMFGSSFSTPISGYNTPLSPASKKQQQDKPADSSTSLSTPLSRVHRPASSGIDSRNRFADEVTRRTIPRRKLSGVSLVSSTVHQQQSSPVPRNTLGNESIGGDLLGEICQNLEDLQNKTNVIRRDGSILPINAESSSPARSQTREATPSDHCSSHSWKDTGLPPMVQDRDRAHPQQKVHHRPLDCRSTFSPKTRPSQDHSMSWGSVVASNSTPRLKSSSHCSDSTHAQVQQPSSSFDQHTCSSLHTQPSTTSEKDNDTLKHKCSRPSPSNGSLAHILVKQIVKRYYKAKEITDREYKRILEKATVKVEAGHQPINEGRVERLIADYVEGYKRNRTALTL